MCARTDTHSHTLFENHIKINTEKRDHTVKVNNKVKRVFADKSRL